jgi:hypothetical protein
VALFLGAEAGAPSSALPRLVPSVMVGAAGFVSFLEVEEEEVEVEVEVDVEEVEVMAVGTVP